MLHKKNLFLRVEVTLNRYRSIQGHLGNSCQKMEFPNHISFCYHVIGSIVMLALTSVAFVVIIARYVPWVSLLCFTEAIYHVVKMYETNEAPLIITVSKPSNSALPIVK